MTAEEKAAREFAVSVRKMTDRQIYDFVGENSGKGGGNELAGFIDRLETQKYPV